MPLKIVKLEVYRKAVGGSPYIKKVLPVSDVDMSLSIREWIRLKIEAEHPNFRYHDNEITLVKTACGTTLDFLLLDEKVSSLGQIFEPEARWYLIIRIDPATSVGRTEGRGFFDIMARSRTKVYVQAKFTMKELKDFLEGFQNCSSSSEKKLYLQNKGSNKITLDEQVNILMCSCLEINGLGYTLDDVSTKVTITNAIGRVCQSLLVFRKHINSLTVNNATTIKSNYVLKHIESLVPTKVNEIGAKRKRSTVEELRQFLASVSDQSKLNKRCWPGYFFQRVSTDKSRVRGQCVVELEEAMNNIVCNTIGRLDDQLRRTAIMDLSKSNTIRPSLLNSGYEFRKGPRYACIVNITYNMSHGILSLFERKLILTFSYFNQLC